MKRTFATARSLLRRGNESKRPGLQTAGTRDRGTSAIEYAIVLPVLLLFLLGIIDTGRLLWTRSTLYRAAEAAARCAAVNTVKCATPAQIQSDAASGAWGLNIAPAAFSVASQACGVEVSANYDFVFATPGFGAVTLSASACYPQ